MTSFSIIKTFNPSCQTAIILTQPKSKKQKLTYAMSVLVLTHVSGGRSKPVIAGCTCVHARPAAAHTVESRS